MVELKIDNKVGYTLLLILGIAIIGGVVESVETTEEVIALLEPYCENDRILYFFADQLLCAQIFLPNISVDYSNCTYLEIPNASNSARFTWDLERLGINESFDLLNLPFDGELTKNDSISRESSYYINSITGSGVSWQNNIGFDGKGAYQIDGSQLDYIDVNEDFEYEGNFSVLAWVKINASTPGAHWYGVANKMASGAKWGWAMRTEDNVLTNAPNCLSANGTAFFSAINNSLSLTPQVWTHMACVYNYTHVTLYVNGVQHATEESPGGVAYHALQNDLNIGNHYSGVASIQTIWNGSIDEFLYINRSLTVEQIEAIYNSNLSTIVAEETQINDTWHGESRVFTPTEETTGGSVTSYVINSGNDNNDLVLDIPVQLQEVCEGNYSTISFNGDFNMKEYSIINATAVETDILYLIPQNTAPSGSSEGWMYFNNLQNGLCLNNGSDWQPIGHGGSC